MNLSTYKSNAHSTQRTCTFHLRGDGEADVIIKGLGTNVVGRPTRRPSQVDGTNVGCTNETPLRNCNIMECSGMGMSHHGCRSELKNSTANPQQQKQKHNEQANQSINQSSSHSISQSIQ